MSSVDELKDAGNKAFAAGNFASAIENFSEAIALDSSNHVLFSNRSAAFASMKKYKEALADAEKTVALKGDWAKGYVRLGAALHGLQQFEDSCKAYEDGLKLEPENKALKDGLAAVSKQMKEDDEKGMNSVANAFAAPDAFAKLYANPSTAAFMRDPAFVEKLNQIRANPQLMQAHMGDQRILQALITLMGLSGKVTTPDAMKKDGAAPFVEEDDDDIEEMQTDSKPAPAPAAAPAAAPTPAAAPAPAAPAEEAAPEEDDGRVKVSAADKAKAAAVKDLGTAAYKKHEFESALKHYAAASALDPTDAIFVLNTSAVYFETKDYDKCMETALQAVDIALANKAPFETLAKAYARASKAAVAKDDLESGLKFIAKALTNNRTPEYVATQRKLESEIAERKRKAYLDPAKATEHKNLGNDLFKAGDFPGAVKEYTESLARNPDDSKVYGNRAACYIKLAAFPLAIQDCEKAIALEPGFIKAYIRKGNALAAMKKFSEAMSAYNHALEIDANNLEAQEGVTKCRDSMYSGMSKKERQEAAMQDPEVQQIMGDPVMNQILQQMVADPKAARDHLKNPAIAAKLQKLVDAGIVSMG